MRISFRRGLLATLLLPALALAWGPTGHRIIGELAQRQLNPQAAAAVADLLRDEPEPSLAGVANWADGLRQTDPELGRRTSRWHFVDVAPGSCDYVPARDCRGDNCVIAAINNQLGMLHDKSQPRAARIQALKFVVHFIGDVHQPLHSSNRPDRGANDYQVSYHGHGTNLHAVWDSLILYRKATTPGDYAARLAMTPVAAPDKLVDAGAAQRWAHESCMTIDAAQLYPSGHIIDDAYLDAHRALAEQRLRLAAARLAAELNSVLASPTPN